MGTVFSSCILIKLFFFFALNKMPVSALKLRVDVHYCCFLLYLLFRFDLFVWEISLFISIQIHIDCCSCAFCMCSGLYLELSDYHCTM